MYLDRLIGIGDVVPFPKRFPSGDHNLNQHATHRRFWNMGYSLLICFYVELQFLVFENRVLFHRLHVYTGIFYRLVRFPSGHLDLQSTDHPLWGSLILLGGRRILCLIRIK